MQWLPEGLAQMHCFTPHRSSSRAGCSKTRVNVVASLLVDSRVSHKLAFTESIGNLPEINTARPSFILDPHLVIDVQDD